jgi:hypothetical protein
VGVVYLAGMVLGVEGNGLAQSILGAPDHLSTVSANGMMVAMGAMLWLMMAVAGMTCGRGAESSTRRRKSATRRSSSTWRGRAWRTPWTGWRSYWQRTERLRPDRKVADPKRPARHDIFTVEHIIFGQDAHRLAWTVDGHRAASWIHDEQHPRAVLQPLGDFLVDFRVEVVGRNNLHGEVRRARPVPTGLANLGQLLGPRESCVGCTDRVWVVRELETHVASHHSPKPLSGDPAPQRVVDFGRQVAMLEALCAWSQNPQGFFIAVALVV